MIESEDLKVTVVTDGPVRAHRTGGVRYYRIRTWVTVENLTRDRLPRDAFEVRQRLSRTIRPAHFFNWVAATPANRGMGTVRLYKPRGLPAINRRVPTAKRLGRELRMTSLLVNAAGENANWARMWTHLFVPEAVAKAGISSRITIVPRPGSGFSVPPPIQAGARVGGAPLAASTWAGGWQVAFAARLDARRFGRMSLGATSRAAAEAHPAATNDLNDVCEGRSRFSGAYFYAQGGTIVGCSSGTAFEGRCTANDGEQGRIRMNLTTGRSCRATRSRVCWTGTYIADGATRRLPWNGRR